MKTLFICNRISVATETTESLNKLRHPISNRDALYRGMLNVGILICLPATALLFRDRFPAWLFMWVIAFALYLGCKWITWRRAPMAWLRSIGYLFLWPGMNPEPFISPALPTAANARGWIRAARNTAAGATLLFSAVYFSNGNQGLWVGWLGMVGIILVLHFGFFDLLAAAWNKAGVRVKPVMQTPIRATSVAEFWGRRWNTAFNDVAYAFAFRPLVQALTNNSSKKEEMKNTRARAIAFATLVVFAISGLVHELVISLPARGGYGLPTAYFMVQGLGVLSERSRVGRRIGLGHGLRGWLFTLACTAGPAFWLFHPTFVRNVILPMLHAFGGQ
jgi:Membrane bound O-acyl transferase family